MDPHRIHHDLYQGPKVLDDPGDAGMIRVVDDLSICEMVSGASAETRTLDDPTKPGIRFTLRLLTDGGGDVVVYAANGVDEQLSSYATFADAGDQLKLISVTKTIPSSTSAAVYRWQTLRGNVGATLA